MNEITKKGVRRWIGVAAQNIARYGQDPRLKEIQGDSVPSDAKKLSLLTSDISECLPDSPIH
jgi:hypothetical protein